MFFSFSFPLEEEVKTQDFKTRIKRINRFFQNKADLSGKSRAFGVQLLVPSDNYIAEESNNEYYLSFRFFNTNKEPQNKLHLMYPVKLNKHSFFVLKRDAYCLSRISSLSLQNVSFSYDDSFLNISIEYSDEDFETIKSYLEMLKEDFKEKVKKSKN